MSSCYSFPLIYLDQDIVIESYGIVRVILLVLAIGSQQCREIAKVRKEGERGRCFEVWHRHPPNWVVGVKPSIVDSSNDLVTYAFNFMSAIFQPSLDLRP